MLIKKQHWRTVRMGTYAHSSTLAHTHHTPPSLSCLLSCALHGHQSETAKGEQGSSSAQTPGHQLARARCQKQTYLHKYGCAMWELSVHIGMLQPLQHDLLRR